MFGISVCLCKPAGFWTLGDLPHSFRSSGAFFASGSPSESESWPSNNLASQLPRSEIQFLEGISHGKNEI